VVANTDKVTDATTANTLSTTQTVAGSTDKIRDKTVAPVPGESASGTFVTTWSAYVSVK
jgi:hypothetical protein